MKDIIGYIVLIVICLLIAGVFYGAIGYVAWHFISKFW